MKFCKDYVRVTRKYRVTCNAIQGPKTDQFNQFNGFIEGRRNYGFSTMSNGLTIELYNISLLKCHAIWQVILKRNFYENRYKLM